eukprot:CAMPEP_0184643874 /NCGR_PEP_ID=MMETSP0308-20130426/688_1 /TAXON_ID=38269 /ORGANISM="Gloeochaete witrockiana, Strain SAG 46.84" /LENGTH=390 /DNA_ID=CAMNT_0027072107 /DNA_START=176 /DNA_END=1348 /DNA_ORIENTATION=+
MAPNSMDNPSLATYKGIRDHLPGFSGFVPGIAQHFGKSFGNATAEAIQRPFHYMRNGPEARPLSASTTLPSTAYLKPGNRAASTGSLGLGNLEEDAEDYTPSFLRTGYMKTQDFMRLKATKSTVSLQERNRYITASPAPGTIPPSKTHMPGYAGFVPEVRDEEPPINPYHPKAVLDNPPIINSSEKRLDYRTDINGIYRHLSQTLKDNPNMKGNKNRLRNYSCVDVGDRDHFAVNFNTTYAGSFPDHHLKKWRPLIMRSPSVLSGMSPAELRDLYVRCQQKIGTNRIINLVNIVRERFRQKSTGGHVELRRVFQIYDKDATGKITLEEFAKTLADSGINLKIEEEKVALMAEFDEDCIGLLDYYIFIDSVLKPEYEVRAEVDKKWLRGFE